VPEGPDLLFSSFFFCFVFLRYLLLTRWSECGSAAVSSEMPVNERFPDSETFSSKRRSFSLPYTERGRPK